MHDTGATDRKRNAAEVAAALRRQIAAAQYLPSERLPSERALAQEFGVARGTLREALRQLEDSGLLKRRAGSGSYVTFGEGAYDPSIADTTSPLQLVDTRVALEPQIVRLAVLHGTERGIATLEEAIRTMERSAGDASRFSPADGQFHLALAECTQNPLLTWFAREVSDVRHNTQWAQMGSVTLTPSMINAYNRQHREIFEAISARSAERAAKAMKAHLAKARSSLVEVAAYGT